MSLHIKRLSSGYYHISGDGPCEWAQPPTWPCDETTLLAHTFPQASAEFFNEMLRRAERDRRAENEEREGK